MSRRRRGALLIGLALALGGLAASDVARREAAVEAQLAPLVDVVIAHGDLAAGRSLRPADLALRRIPARYAPVGAVAVPEELVGRRLAAGLPRGGYVADGLLRADAPAAAAPVRRGERAVEVVGTGSLELVVPGARVDVVTSPERGAAQIALEDTEVLATRPLAAPDGPDGPVAARVAATLRVSVRQALFLASLESRARAVRLLPRAPGDRRRSRGANHGG